MKPLLPVVENKCDKCGDVLVTRKDDTKTVILNWLKTYNQETLPLLKFFDEHKVKRIDFEPKKGVQDYPGLKEIISKAF